MSNKKRDILMICMQVNLAVEAKKVQSAIWLWSRSITPLLTSQTKIRSASFESCSISFQ